MILFLDYDGVLHPDHVYLVNGRPVLRADGELFMWAPILARILAPYPDLKIVLSTSWVRLLGFNRAKSYLPRELRDRVIGGTWHSAMGRHGEGAHRLEGNWFVAASRFQQIATYVSRAGARAEHWLALDDDGEGWSQLLEARLILTDSDRGLSDVAAQAALRSRLTREARRGASQERSRGTANSIASERNRRRAWRKRMRRLVGRREYIKRIIVDSQDDVIDLWIVAARLNGGRLPAGLVSDVALRLTIERAIAMPFQIIARAGSQPHSKVSARRP